MDDPILQGQLSLELHIGHPRRVQLFRLRLQKLEHQEVFYKEHGGTVGGSLRRCGGGMVAEKEKAGTSTASLGQDGEIDGIRDDAKYHVTSCMISNDGIWMDC